MATNFGFPTNIRFGSGVISELPEHLKTQKLTAPMLVTDSTLKSLPFFENIVTDLEKAGLKVTVFCDTHKNPIISDVEKGALAFRESNCDSIVGIGGGAPLDISRAVALKVNHDEPLANYEEAVGGDQKITNPIPYFVTVPTTSGTGSEVGRSAVISDDNTHQKKIFFHPSLLAKQVFADPLLTMDLPPHVTAATGMDALVHNIEAYLSKGFHPMCDGIALEGIRLISNSLVKATNDPDEGSRTYMLAAAMMGAVAFQKGLGLVHSAAHALSTLKDLHHGLANSIMLPWGLTRIIDVSGDRMKMIAQTMELDDTSPESLIKHLQGLNKLIGLPTSLSTQGVVDADCDKLADLALADVCHQCNARTIVREDFEAMFRSAL